MSPYAGEFVPDAAGSTSSAVSRPRRGSDPSSGSVGDAAQEAHNPTRANPRQAYQYRPNAAPKPAREPNAGLPHLSSPAAALRMMVYDRLDMVGAQQAALYSPDTVAKHEHEVGSLAYMLPFIREEGDRRVHSDIIHTFAKEASRRDSDVPTDELVDVLGAAIFAFEQYRLGEPEFESSIRMLDRDINSIEKTLTASQDEAASELRKLIRAANGKMDAIRRRLAIAASPDRSLATFRSMCSGHDEYTGETGSTAPTMVPRPALVAVGCDVISAKIQSHVSQLHRMAEQAGHV